MERRSERGRPRLSRRLIIGLTSCTLPSASSCAVAEVTSGAATVWSATQGAHQLRPTIAQLLGISPANVRVIYVEAAGCYGHNGADDAAADAALLSQAVGKPVRVQWMRQDEHVWEPLGPAMVMEVRGGLDQAGNVVAWDFQGWTPTHSSRPNGSAGSLLAGTLTGMRIGHAEPVRRRSQRQSHVQFQEQPGGGPLACALVPCALPALRGLGSPQNTFANESFIDELAAAAGDRPHRVSLAPSQRRARQSCVGSGGQTRRLVEPAAVSNETGVKSGRGVAFVQYDRTEAYVAGRDRCRRQSRRRRSTREAAS